MLSVQPLKTAGRVWARFSISLLLVAALVPSVRAGSTDIAQAPLVTSSTQSVKPNLMFVLDDSGSMADDFLPDEAGFATNKYGRYSYQCNGLGYNPDTSVSYPLPVDSNGNALPNASTSALDPNPATQTTAQHTLSGSPAISVVSTGALNVTVTSSGRKSNWYSSGTTVTIWNSGDTTRYMVGTVSSWNYSTGALQLTVTSAVGTGSFSTPMIGNGSPSSPIYYKYTGSQPLMGWSYPNGVLDTTTTFYKECNSVVGSSPGNAVFTAVTVNSASADAQRYANWQTYYRTRILMMRSALSLAFKTMDDKYRIGYTTISNTGVTASSDFLDISDFNATQKSAFYTAFNAASPGGWTPLRGALSKAGNYFAHKASGQTVDPIQYSCQKNFTILATDGYWNTPAETSTYGPFNLNGNNVGEQDGSGTPRPMLDGASTKTTTTETWTDTTTTVTQKSTPTTNTSTTTKVTTTLTPVSGWQQNVYTLAGATTQAANSSLARCGSLSSGNCTITVTTTANHGFTTGQTITIAGANPSAYNGSFTVTVTGTKTFTYKLTGLSSRPASATTAGTSTYQPYSCPVGQGKVSTQVQQRDLITTTILTETSGSSTTSYAITTTTTTVNTPKTHTVITIDGTVSSDTTTSGTPTTSTSSTNSSSSDPAVPFSSSTTSSSNSYTSWVNTGTAAVSGSCTGALPSPNPSAATQLGSTTTSGSSNVTSNTVPSSSTGTATTQTLSSNTTSSAKTSNTTTQVSGGSSDSLADVAMYYYKTDLRDSSLSNCTGALGTSVCDNNVTPSGVDTASWQHMSTYTIGLGLSGVLKYDPNYETQTSGDFYDIKQGTKNWPVAGPTQTAANIDDLWHAAVDGRGRYFSASDPTTVAKSLRQALNAIVEKVGSGSAAATSTLQPVSGDNGIFVAQFTSGAWTGDLLAYKIDLVTGNVPTTTTDSSGNLVSAAAWSAAKQLDAMVTAGTARKIYYRSGSGLSDFNFAMMDSTHQAYFSKACSGQTPALSQCGGMSSTDIATADSGANMVNYLRGASFSVYRTRAHILGDIGNSTPVYVGKPAFKYTEHDYASFVSAQASRQPVIYVGANDGMLHAFDANTGNELWAYVPTMVMPNMYKLADVDYGLSHQYFVDGTPTVADIYVSGAWKTILIGGLNAGGRGYYALDITDPANPKSLWEFTDDNLGLSFSTPTVTKRANGTWVAAFGSGYNNNTGNGTGRGYLYVLNAYTGVQEITKLDTGAGTTSAPSGLARINAWVDSDIDNTQRRIYGGDLLGNIWRFDIDGTLDTVNHLPNVAPVATLIANGKPQPITVQPQLAEVTSNGLKVPVIYVGTGKYLGTSDLGTSDVQSIYAIKDPLNTTGLGDVRASGTLVQQTLTDATDSSGQKIRKITGNTVDWSVQNGWYVDLPTAGERVNVDPQIVFNVLTVASNIPTADACSAGGSSWLYRLDLTSGSSIASAVASQAGTWLGNKQIVGSTSYQLPNGTVVTENTYADGTLGKGGEGFSAGAAGPARRTSWRELIEDAQ